MKYKYTVAACLILLFSNGCTIFSKHNLYRSARLEVSPISKHTFLHKSYIATEQWGKVACNGAVYINDGMAVVFDTPTNDSAATELIQWITKKQKATIVAVVVNHFHADCLGGLNKFHELRIPSYASERTCFLARKDLTNYPAIPTKEFDSELILDIGNQKVINRFMGEGHTKDNIVSYIPSERFLFGGCLIKALQANKGNLADANEGEWSQTVRKVKEAFPDAKYVVPGHGAYGDTSLLGYTINLFSAH